MKPHLFGRFVRLAAAPVAASAFVLAASTAARAADEEMKSDLDAAVQSTVFRGDPVSNAYDDIHKWKQDNGIPIEVGAWHWWHMFRNKVDGSRQFQYGKRGLEGTYFWWLHFDPETDNGAGTKMGFHLDARVRDGRNSFRSHYDSKAWLWESYGWVEACDTKFKIGKIWRRFGMDWDDSWYGNVAYFDGWKLDPDWGASVERTYDFGNGITAPCFLQAFTGRVEDEVNPEIGGATVESDERARENYTLVGRCVPTWKTDKGTIALGLSMQGGQIASRDVGNHSYTAEAVDVTYTQGPWKVFGEAISSQGFQSNAHFATGGNSDRSRVLEVGGAYMWRYLTIRGAVSKGDYRGPGGQQLIYLLGVTCAVTKNVDFYVEWVRWDVASQRDHNGRAYFDDGINFIIAWRF